VLGGRSRRPPSTSPDPRFPFLTAQHQEALAKCQAVINSRLGASATYSDIGAGKTTLARQLLDLDSLSAEER
jgi:general secretion pathway protein A